MSLDIRVIHLVFQYLNKIFQAHIRSMVEKFQSLWANFAYANLKFSFSVPRTFQ